LEEHEIDNSQVNIAPLTPNMIAIAMDIKHSKLAFTYAVSLLAREPSWQIMEHSISQVVELRDPLTSFGAMEQRLSATRSLFPTLLDIQL
jgi:hypothetical protein